MIPTKIPLPPQNTKRPPSRSATVISPEAVANLMKSLLGRDVMTRSMSIQRSTTLETPLIAVYRDDNNRVRALCCCDVTLGANVAAALTLIPASVALDAIAAKVLPDVLRDNLREVLNVCAQLLNHNSSYHAVLCEVCFGDEVPQDIDRGSLQACLDAEVTIKGYGVGRFQLYNVMEE
jgi:hypothetical protein